MKTLTLDQTPDILETFNQHPSGAFAYIEGYTPVKGEGEVANYYFQCGISYPNIVEMSKRQLELLMEGEHPIKEVTVDINTWKDDKNGTYHNRPKGKERTLRNFKKTYAWDDDAFQEACIALMESLEDPKDVTIPYEKEAKSLYSIDGEDEQKTLYIRECLILKKIVVQEGEKHVAATTPEIGLKNAIKKHLSVNRYRTFKLINNFEKISINKTSIENDELEGDEVALDISLI